MRALLLALAMFLVMMTAAQAGRIVITRVKPKPAPKPAAPPVKKVPLPGPADANSLGFGSARADVERVLGKPTRVEKVEKKEIWFYDHSTVTLGQGRVIAWSVYDRPLRVNIGAPKPNAPPAKVGQTLEQLVAAKGTPSTVVVNGTLYLWFYGTQEFVLRDGRVVPADIMVQMQTAANKEASAPKQPTSSRGGREGGDQKCFCPL